MQTTTDAAAMIPAITQLLSRQSDMEKEFATALAAVDPHARASAENLLHYLAVRQIDMRPLQWKLIPLGLTSLGGMEASSRCSIQAVSRALHALAGVPAPEFPAPPVDFVTGPLLLQTNANRLLGAPCGKRAVRIMVTMPSEASQDYELVLSLLKAGMDVMRINCAHDSATAWESMVENLRRAERETGRSCKVYTDLAGPKLRTGPVESLGRIRKVRPVRDARGVTVAPALVWFTSSGEKPPDGVSDVIPVNPEVLEGAVTGCSLALDDAREKFRELKILSYTPRSVLAEALQTCYFETGARLHLLDRSGDVVARGEVGSLPAIGIPIALAEGDSLILIRDGQCGSHALRDEDGHVLKPARIPCTLGAIFDSVKPSERIFFDDGKIGGCVESRTHDEVSVRITRTGVKGGKLRPEKGINLPDTDLLISALTEKDIADLAFVAKHSDVVGLSFVRTPADVIDLQGRLRALGAEHVGIVLKIENRTAFQNLPQLLLAGQRWPSLGIMIARGDLAVEIGFDRLSEVQEEILWLSEAAHVPVVWATQILETLAKTGSPSRAEVTDAVASGNAECAMLNKGPYITQAVQFLSGVLERVEAHHMKKHNLLRKLSVSDLQAPGPSAKGAKAPVLPC